METHAPKLNCVSQPSNISQLRSSILMKYAILFKKFSDGASANHTTQVSVVTSSSTKLKIYIVIK
jgi:hypothetical protein